MHDDGRAEAAKNTLLSFGDSRARARRSSVVILRWDILRMNDLVEIVRQPILVLRQCSETVLRALKFADLARNIGMFEQFGAFCRFCAILFCLEHGMLPAWDAPGGCPRDGPCCFCLSDAGYCI